MTDLSMTVAPKSDQLTADDLQSGPRTITITDVRGVVGEQPVAISFEGDNGKPFYPCKTIRRVLLGIWGKDGKSYIGRSLTLYRDPKVKFGGLEVGGIRVRQASHIDRSTVVPVQASKGAKIGYKVEPLKTERATPAEDTAADWAASFVAKVNATDDLEALAMLEADNAKALEKLDRTRPDLTGPREAVKLRFAALSQEAPAHD